MVTITDSSIRNTIYETVHDLLSANVASSITIYGGYPDISTISYPNIIIMPINVSEDSFTIDTSRSESSKTILVNIMIFSKANKSLDIIADLVSYTLRSNTFNGAYLTSVSEDDIFISPNDQKIKGKSLSFTYVRR